MNYAILNVLLLAQFGLDQKHGKYFLIKGSEVDKFVAIPGDLIHHCTKKIKTDSFVEGLGKDG